MRIFGANFFGEKLVSANFYAFCNYEQVHDAMEAAMHQVMMKKLKIYVFFIS